MKNIITINHRHLINNKIFQYRPDGWMDGRNPQTTTTTTTSTTSPPRRTESPTKRRTHRTNNAHGNGPCGFLSKPTHTLPFRGLPVLNRLSELVRTSRRASSSLSCARRRWLSIVATLNRAQRTRSVAVAFNSCPRKRKHNQTNERTTPEYSSNVVESNRIACLPLHAPLREFSLAN